MHHRGAGRGCMLVSHARYEGSRPPEERFDVRDSETE